MERWALRFGVAVVLLLCCSGQDEVLNEASGSLTSFSAEQLEQLRNAQLGKVSRDQIEIVIAQNDEDISWSDVYSSIRTVYCKTEAGLPNCIKLPNVGREAHTYLHHIVDNYFTLAKWTVFSRATDPLGDHRGHRLDGRHLMPGLSFHDYVLPEHRSALKPSDGAFFVFTGALNLSTLDLSVRSRHLYLDTQRTESRPQRCAPNRIEDKWEPYVSLGWFRDYLAAKCRVDSSQVGNALVDYWRANMEMPLPKSNVVFFSHGSRFAASKERIWQRPRSFYQGLLSLVSTDQNACANYFNEWLWFYIIGKPNPDACNNTPSTHSTFLPRSMASCGEDGHVNCTATHTTKTTTAVSHLSANFYNTFNATDAAPLSTTMTSTVWASTSPIQMPHSGMNVFEANSTSAEDGTTVDEVALIRQLSVTNDSTNNPTTSSTTGANFTLSTSTATTTGTALLMVTGSLNMTFADGVDVCAPDTVSKIRRSVAVSIGAVAHISIYTSDVTSVSVSICSRRLTESIARRLAASNATVIYTMSGQTPQRATIIASSVASSPATFLTAFTQTMAGAGITVSGVTMTNPTASQVTTTTMAPSPPPPPPPPPPPLSISTNVTGSLPGELPTIPFPVEGGGGPDTYQPNLLLTTCSLLSPYPSAASVPWAPSVDNAKAFCSARRDCGGFIYTSAQANFAGSGVSISEATYCRPQTFAAGAGLSASSGIAFIRHLYLSCVIKVQLSTSWSSYQGTLTGTRNVCMRPGRGLSTARDRSPRPNNIRYRVPAQRTVQLDGGTYIFGTQAFRTQEAAQNASIDGSSYYLDTAAGVRYYLPGNSHATRGQSEKPFAMDGYYPLYITQVGAQAASTRGGGNGQAQGIGPLTVLGSPARWLAAPYTQTFYMPADITPRYYGDYVPPMELDGYFPLYRQKSAAQKASSDGTAQSYGPGSDAGQPLSWSTGQIEMFYMPSAGVEKFQGTYVPQADGPLDLYATVLDPPADHAQRQEGAAAASQAVAAANLQRMQAGPISSISV